MFLILHRRKIHILASWSGIRYSLWGVTGTPLLYLPVSTTTGDFPLHFAKLQLCYESLSSGIQMIAIIYYLMLLLSIPAAIYFLVLFTRSKQRKCLAAALLWLIPLPYEVFILSTCAGDCNIRVDLLVVLPLELVVLIPISKTAYRAYTKLKKSA
jgi:hypothetical protein